MVGLATWVDKSHFQEVVATAFHFLKAVGVFEPFDGRRWYGDGVFEHSRTAVNHLLCACEDCGRVVGPFRASAVADGVDEGDE